MPKELEFGQTQFDSMTREELIKHAAQLYCALVSANSVMRQHAQDSVYWTKGTGYRALTLAQQALDKSTQEFSSGDLYHSFYRYAEDLLFIDPNASDSVDQDISKRQIGFHWCRCNKCGDMLSGGRIKEGAICKEVQFAGKDCNGVFEKISWDDIVRPDLK